MLNCREREQEQLCVPPGTDLIQAEDFCTKSEMLRLTLQDKNIPVIARSCSSGPTLIIWAVVSSPEATGLHF